MKISFTATAMALSVVVSGCAATSQAPAPGLIVADDFESTAVGAIPAGFTKTGELGVEEGVAHSGKHALMIQPGVRGGRSIDLAPDKVAALGGEHWGRLYYKIKMPAPLPTGRSRTIRRARRLTALPWATCRCASSSRRSTASRPST